MTNMQDLISFPAVNRMNVAGIRTFEIVKRCTVEGLLDMADYKGLLGDSEVLDCGERGRVILIPTMEGKIVAAFREKGGKTYSYVAVGVKEEARRRNYAGF